MAVKMQIVRSFVSTQNREGRHNKPAQPRTLGGPIALDADNALQRDWILKSKLLGKR
jgi:hypothetical protein